MSGPVEPCSACGRPLGDTGYQLAGAPAGQLVCLRCAVVKGPLVKRALKVAAFVGSCITTINQGDLILSPGPAPALWWKIPLTYCVPFSVSLYSALAAARRELASAPAQGGASPP